jgi:hypothetical protein
MGIFIREACSVFNLNFFIKLEKKKESGEIKMRVG